MRKLYLEECVCTRVYFVTPGVLGVKTVMEVGGLLTSCMFNPLCANGATRLTQDKCVTHADI